MGWAKVISREYKLMLRAGQFHGDESSVLQRAGRFWHEFTQANQKFVLGNEGGLDKIKKRRKIRFFDTPGHLLRTNDYVFRERVDHSGNREVTLKFRHPDRYVAQGRDMAAAKVNRGYTKFEQDVKPPFQELYSFSTTQKIADDKNLNNMDDPGRLFPGLPKKLAGYDRNEALEVVGKGFTASEMVVEGASIQIGKSPKVQAECALIVWSDAMAGAGEPVVVEFSFRYGDDDEKYGGRAAKRAFDVFQALQAEVFSEWVDPESKTKTAYVYSLAELT